MNDMFASFFESMGLIEPSRTRAHMMPNAAAKKRREINVEFTNAIINNNVETVTKLLDQGFDPDSISSSEHVPMLHEALIHGQMDIIKLLVNRGADINIIQDESNGNDFTILDNVVYAITEDSDYCNFAGMSPDQTIDFITFLLDNGADPRRYSNSGNVIEDTKTILEHAKRYPTLIAQECIELYTRIVDTLENYLQNNVERKTRKCLDKENPDPIRCLTLLRNVICRNIDANMNLKQIRGMAKVLEISKYDTKDKATLCADIGARLTMTQLGVKMPLIGDFDTDEDPRILFSEETWRQDLDNLARQEGQGRWDEDVGEDIEGDGAEIDEVPDEMPGEIPDDIEYDENNEEIPTEYEEQMADFYLRNPDYDDN